MIKVILNLDFILKEPCEKSAYLVLVFEILNLRNLISVRTNFDISSQMSNVTNNN